MVVKLIHSKLKSILCNCQRARKNKSLALTLAVCVFVILLFGVSLLVIQPELSQEDIRSLVSVIGGALTGVFSFVFIISLFLVTLAKERLPEYEPWILRHAFGKLTVSYMVIFIVSIMLPFITLMTGLNIFLAYGSLILFFACIVLLVPYFLNLNKVINTDPVALLKKEIALKIAKNQSPNRNVSFLSMMASNAFSTKNYIFFWRCLDAILDIMLSMIDRIGRPKKKLEVFSTSIEVVMDGTDPLYYIMKSLEQICLLTTNETPMVRELMAMLLFKCRFIDKSGEYFFEFCSKVFFLIGEFAINQGLTYESERVAERLWMLGAIAVKRGMQDVTKKIIDTISRYYKKYKPSRRISLSASEREWILQDSRNYNLDPQSIEEFEEQVMKYSNSTYHDQSLAT